MKKSTTTRMWVTGLALIVVALIPIGVGVGLMLSSAGTWTTTAPGVYHFNPTIDSFFWTTVAVTAVGGVTLLTGIILQFAAWIGAMVNTARAHDKTWFVLLLVLGLLGLQFVVMIVYLVAGPDVPPAPPTVAQSAAFTPPAPPPVRAA